MMMGDGYMNGEVEHRIGLMGSRMIGAIGCTVLD